MVSSAIDLRQAFLDFFTQKGHQPVPSSPLIPANDPTLLFTNAGMVQFKETFLGLERRNYPRAVTSQRCVRAGGKHNDLENVGYTARHHTFFEMLGNFSFGDYFKREAIAFAWEFLTEILKLPPEKLWVTIYLEDDESADIWLKEMKIDPQRFSRCGEKDNFWMMGETGPCGPCTEIYYDHGAHIAGGPPGSPDADGDRYIEIWNLVFMQYNRAEDGTLTPLPKPSVDTGMGLERLAAVVQGVHNNYDIDLFQHLLHAIRDITGVTDTTLSSMRVIADHIRACAFLIVDGVLPANEGRGYVLRRIIRRAIRHGYQLGVKEPFFYRLVAALETEMGAAYPELSKARDKVERVLKQEEERFATTLEQGLSLLEKSIQQLEDTVITGDIAFKLYDTYGFPVDLTADIAREKQLTVDMVGFEREMEAQRERARAASHFVGNWAQIPASEYQTVFQGYQHLASNSTILSLFVDDKPVKTISVGQKAQLILDNTPFYAESGGQVGDTGLLICGEHVFTVEDTQKVGQAFVHIGKVSVGELQVGDQVFAKVNKNIRQATARNHSATHLLHAALRQILGEHVAQKGSLVNANQLRFDFSHFEPISNELLQKIETLVNAQILSNVTVDTRLMALDEALQSGAMALFGEKYDTEVRVLRMGDFSTELCGGTHVQQTGEIGLFKIISETGVAAGVRRIEALTGTNAFEWVSTTEQTLNKIINVLKTSRESLEDRLQQLLTKSRATEKELERMQAKFASVQGDDLVQQAINIKGINVLAACLDNVDVKQLRDTLDQLKNKLSSAAVVLANVKDNKITLIAGVTSDYTDRIHAGQLVNHVALQVGGKGGGRADMAQAGGTEPSQLSSALQSVTTWVAAQLP